MKIELINLSAGIEAARQQPFALIIELSKVTYGPTPKVLDPTEWVEAHFFGALQEVRFLPGDSGLEASVMTEEENDITIDYTAEVILPEGKDTGFLARKYLSVDEDGQSCIEAVRLVAKEDSL